MTEKRRSWRRLVLLSVLAGALCAIAAQGAVCVLGIEAKHAGWIGPAILMPAIFMINSRIK